MMILNYRNLHSKFEHDKIKVGDDSVYNLSLLGYRNTWPCGLAGFFLQRTNNYFASYYNSE